MFFDTEPEITYSFNKKRKDKNFDTMGLGSEAVVCKKKVPALLGADRRALQRCVEIRQRHASSI